MVTVFDLFIYDLKLSFNCNFFWTCAIRWHFLETCKDSFFRAFYGDSFFFFNLYLYHLKFLFMIIIFIFNLFLTLIATFTFINRINI